MFFDGLPIYYINLDRHQSRNERLLESFERYGIKEYKRISGVDGKGKRIKVLQSRGQVPVGSPQAALILSYFKVVQTFLRNESSEYILMCDDDIDFANSLKIDFNFYDTLEHHAPEYYNLKVVTNDVNGQHYPPVAKLHKAPVISYGQATIINKKWAEHFLQKYGFLEGDAGLDSIVDLTPYTSNLNGSNSGWVLPASDALNFDEYTYIWRVFTCFEAEDTSVGLSNMASWENTPNSTWMDTQQYVKELNENTNRAVLEELTYTDRSLTIDTFKKS